MLLAVFGGPNVGACPRTPGQLPVDERGAPKDEDASRVSPENPALLHTGPGRQNHHGSVVLRITSMRALISLVGICVIGT
jgi:hypothetical protein